MSGGPSSDLSGTTFAKPSVSSGAGNMGVAVEVHAFGPKSTNCYSTKRVDELRRGTRSRLLRQAYY